MKNYLEKYLLLIDQIEDAKELREVIFASATGGTGKIDAAGYVSGGYSSNVVENAVILMDGIDEKIYAKEVEAERIKSKIERLIRTIPDTTTQTVLRMTYLEGASRGEIAAKLKRSYQTVTYRRGAGIKAIAAYLDEVAEKPRKII